jgi:hypothetical protein
LLILFSLKLNYVVNIIIVKIRRWAIMSKNNDDPMKKILERRQFIEDEQDDIPVQDMNDEFDDIPAPTSAGKKVNQLLLQQNLLRDRLPPL